MKKKMFMVLLSVAVVGAVLAGCGNGTSKTKEEVTPVVEEVPETETAEDVEEETVTDETVTDETVADETAVDESILSEPAPETVEEAKEVLYAITDPQLAWDYILHIWDFWDFDVNTATEEERERGFAWDSAIAEYFLYLEEADTEFFEKMCKAMRVV